MKFKISLAVAIYLLCITIGAFGFTETKITPNMSQYEKFGSSVDISGNWAVVGVPEDNEPLNASGSVYVFQRSGPDWLEHSKLIYEDLTAYDEFGTSVAIDGDTPGCRCSGQVYNRPFQLWSMYCLPV